MATQISRRKGTSAEIAAFKGVMGEITVNETKRALHVHDGVVLGGNRTLMENELGAVSGVASLGADQILLNGQLPSRLQSNPALVTDIDAISAAGWYRHAVGAAGQPIAAAGIVEHLKSDTRAIQNWYQLGATVRYTRYHNGTAWSAWTPISITAASDIAAVADRAALKALDPSTIKVAYLKEISREGDFVWRTGNFSAKISSDPLEAIYIASGSVSSTSGAWVRSFSGPALVEWWGWKGDGVVDDGAILNAAIRTCRGTGIEVRQRFNGFFGTRVQIEGSDIFQAETGAVVKPLALGGATEAFYFTNGNFDRRIVLPQCRGFTSAALRLSQVARTDIYIGQINGSDNYPTVSPTAVGVIMEGSCLDCKVTIVTGELCNTLIKIVPTTGGGAVFQGNEVYCNFSVYNKNTVVYALTGSTPWADSNKFQFQAIDPAENTTQCIALLNTNGTNPVTRVLFKCECWLGGFTTADSVFVQGYFDDYDIYARVADPDVGAAKANSFFAFLLTGNGRIDLAADMSWGSRTAASTTANSRDTWRGGTALFANRLHLDTNISVAAGEYLSHYIYSPLITGVDVKATFVPRDMLGGIVLNKIETTGVERELLIQFRNLSGAAISGFLKYDVVLGK